MSDLHLDVALTNMSVRFSQSADKFVARSVFPPVNVANKSDKYWIYDRSYWFKTEAELRGPGAESAGSGYELTTGNFTTDVYAIHKDIDDQTRANADSQIALDSDATQFVTTHLLQKYEQDWVSNFFTTGVWGTDLTPTNKWDDYVNGDPISDMRTAVMTMAETTALKPNTLVLGPEVWNKLQDHPDFLARVSGGATTGTPALWSEAQLASMIGVDRVLVAWSVRNTAAEGETASYSFNFGKNALMCYTPSSPGLNTPAAGYTFNWTGLIGQGSDGIRIKRFRLERNASDRIEAESAFAQKVISSELGYFFNAAVS
jgi:hypothetical protein